MMLFKLDSEAAVENIIQMVLFKVGCEEAAILSELSKLGGEVVVDDIYSMYVVNW